MLSRLTTPLHRLTTIPRYLLTILRYSIIPLCWLLWVVAVVTAQFSRLVSFVVVFASFDVVTAMDYIGLWEVEVWLTRSTGGQIVSAVANHLMLTGAIVLVALILQRTTRQGFALLLKIVAVFIVLVGLLMAYFNYELAFGSGRLNQFHVMRGLTYNIGSYTLARMLVWIATWIQRSPSTCS